MGIVLDHTIVPAHDKVASAAFFAKMFGLSVGVPAGPFSPVQVNDSLTLDFANATTFEPHHLAFMVTDEEFDAILGRVTAEGLPHGSEPYAQDNGQINTRRGGRGFYFKDANRHSLEVMTR
jgi:catechol 2,3-dioxygenase-like lactoylglutathione lyase family enzyme